MTGDKAELKYTIPLSNDGPLAENLEVPHIVRYGGAERIRTSTYQKTSGKVFSKVLPFERNGGPFWTGPELLFESKKLIPTLQQLNIGHIYE